MNIIEIESEKPRGIEISKCDKLRVRAVSVTISTLGTRLAGTWAPFMHCPL